MWLIVNLAYLLYAIRSARGFVYSSEEVQYKLINTDVRISAMCAGLFADHALDSQLLATLKHISLQTDQVTYSLFDAYSCPDCTCDKRSAAQWKLVADISVNWNDDFTLVFKSPSDPVTVLSYSKINNISMSSGYLGIISPECGIIIRSLTCSGAGEIRVFTGIGTGEDEEMYPLVSWACADAPDTILSFDMALSIVAYEATIGFFARPGRNIQITMTEQMGKVAILSSGRSDNRQNMDTAHNSFDIQLQYSTNVAISYNLSFDPILNENVTMYTDTFGRAFGSGSGYCETDTTYIFVYYNTPAISADQVWNSQYNILIEISPSKTTRLPSPSSTNSITPTSATRESGPYCGCELDHFYMANGWDTKQIWLDVVIILDTSEAMGENSLSDAASLIESFIGDDSTGYDVLITDPKAQFYSRIGLISMADKAEVLYNLNMTKYDKVKDKAKIATGVTEINVLAAFDAALDMFTGAQPTRPDVRRVIYYMTNSDPGANLGPVNQFKTSNGIIIVNNYLTSGEVEVQGLRDLASDGYYYTGIQENYMFTIQAFCKANCFCKADRESYSGAVVDPATKAAGGCYHPGPSGVSFGKARQACASNRGGLIASPHDTDKAAFLNNVLTDALPSPKPYFFWIGYSKIDDGTNWRWEDGSTDSFTNWAKDEPSTAAISQCAFVDQSSPRLEWGAGNCQVGFPYVCEYAPCSVGNKDC